MHESQQISISRQNSVSYGLKFPFETKPFGEGPLCLITTSAILFESYPFLTFISDSSVIHIVFNINIFDDLSAMILHVLWRPRFVSSQNARYLHIVLCSRFFAAHILCILSCHVNCPPRSIWGTSFMHLIGLIPTLHPCWWQFWSESLTNAFNIWDCLAIGKLIKKQKIFE